jgi:hypothetical protein
MSGYRFANLPSNGSVAAVVTLVVSAWFTVAAAAMLADGAAAPAAQEPQHAVLMEEAVPASPTPLPVAAAATPAVCEKIVVEGRRLVAVPAAYEKIVVEAVREHA